MRTRSTRTAESSRASILPDLLLPNLPLVICGSAAGNRSAALRQYYAGHGNKFWRTLLVTGLTPRQLAPAEFRLLPALGIGLTDLVKSQSGGDHQLDFGGDHAAELYARIEQAAPRVLCFNGKRSAMEFFGVKRIAFGLQPETIGHTTIFVAPSTSAAANATWDLEVWREVAGIVRATSLGD